MASKKIKKILPITIGAVTATSVAVAVPVVLTTKNKSTTDFKTNQNQTNPVEDLDKVQDDQNNGSASTDVNQPTQDDSIVDNSSNSSGQDNTTTTPVEDDSNDVVVDGNQNEQDQTNDEVTETLLADLQQTVGSNNVVFGDVVGFKLTPKLKNGLTYTYSWRIVNTTTNQSYDLLTNSDVDTLSINTNQLQKAGSYRIEGTITRTNESGLALTSETVSKSFVVSPKINLNLTNASLKNNQANAKIVSSITFDGIDETEYNDALQNFSFKWTKDGKNLTSGFDGTNTKDLTIKLATPNNDGIYTLTATSNNQKVSANVSVAVGEASFAVKLDGSNSKQIGSTVEMNASVESKTRTNDQFTYAWYVKQNSNSQAQLLSVSDSPNYSLKELSKTYDNGAQYYVVVQNKETGEVQWTNQPFNIEVDSPIESNFQLGGNQDLMVGNTETIVPVMPLSPQQDNVSVEYEWNVWVGNSGVVLGNDTVNNYQSYNIGGYNVSINEGGKNLSITNNQENKSNDISVQMIVRYWSKGTNGKSRILDSISSSIKTIKSTKNNVKYTIDTSKIESIKSMISSITNNDFLNSFYTTDSYREFGVKDEMKKQIVKSLGLKEVETNLIDIDLIRGNNSSNKVSFDLQLTINNSNYVWSSVESKSSSVDYSMDGNVLTIKNIQTQIDPYFTVTQEVSAVKDNNNQVSVKVNVNDAEKNIPENVALRGWWYFKDSDGKFKRVQNNAKFTNVRFENQEQGKILMTTLKFDSFNGDLDSTEFYCVVSPINMGIAEENWNNDWYSIAEWNQTPIKINNNK